MYFIQKWWHDICVQFYDNISPENRQIHLSGVFKPREFQSD